MRTLLRIIVALFLIVLIVFGAAGGYVYATLRRPLPQTTGTLTLPGLDGEVTVYRDAAGVPQIYASTPRDLFFAQGVVTAQDRWWQMEFNRHTGLGRISELTGKNENALKSDRFIRTLGWNRAAKMQLDALPDPTRTILQNYADGVNAYIVGKSGPELAIEYAILGVRGINIPIENWEPLHTMAWAQVMSYSLSGNYDTELERARLYQLLGDKAVVDTFYGPDYPYGTMPTILRNEDLPPDLQATAADMPRIMTARADMSDIKNVQTKLIGAIDAKTFGPLFGRGYDIGSNNWVLSGKLTESGKPLLSNDPHLAIQMPSIWYEVGLHCTAVSDACPYDVEGFSFPGVPGVIIGHNARIAWGVTNVGPDTQDLYIIKTDPNDDTKYELDGKTESMQVINEVIKFGDNQPDETIRVRVTHFGPIITEVSDSAAAFGKPLALKWTALNEKYDLLGSFLGLDKAKNYDEFRAALSTFGSPSQNVVYADVDGNIAYQTPGLIPIRAAGHDGKTPIDGSTTKFDWKGFIPFDYLPRALNPARGFIATANNAVVPQSYYTHLATVLGDKFGKDSDYTISYEWDYGYRATRIEDLIQKSPKNSVESMKAIQGDNYLIPAAEQIPYVLNLDFGGAIPKELIDKLRTWDYQMNMNSPEAALYAAFWSNLTRLTWEDNIGSTPDGTNIMTGMKALLDQPDNAIWDDVSTKDKKETRDDILREAMIAGYKELQQKLGNDYKLWQWGALHLSRYVSNPLGASGIDIIEQLVNGGPVPTSGGQATVNATGWSAGGNYETRGHPSLRMIVDLNDLNKSLWIQSTGQSGHPLSEHYRDMIDKWRLIQYNAMPWGADSIKAAAKDVLTLTPKK